MKKLLLLMLFPVLLWGQETITIKPVEIDSPYSVSHIDTSATFTIPVTKQVGLFLNFADSANAIVYCDYRLNGTRWATYTVVDSVNSATNAGAVFPYILRDGIADHIPGATTVRFRIQFLTTRIGVTSATYRNHLWYNTK